MKSLERYGWFSWRRWFPEPPLHIHSLVRDEVAGTGEAAGVDPSSRRSPAPLIFSRWPGAKARHLTHPRGVGACNLPMVRLGLTRNVRVNRNIAVNRHVNRAVARRAVVGASHARNGFGGDAKPSVSTPA